MPNGNDDTDVMTADASEGDTQPDQAQADQAPSAPAQSPEAAVSQTPWSEDIPLGGGRGGQLPPLGGAPPAPVTLPPVGANIHARHGGFLTGLAGVLLDGLAAGLGTPQGPSGFANAFQAARNMPAQRQQQAQEQIKFEDEHQLNQAKLAIAQIKVAQGRAMLKNLPDAQMHDVVTPFMNFMNALKDGDYADFVAQSSDPTAIANHANELRMQAGKDGASIVTGPLSRQGDSYNLGVLRLHSNDVLKKDLKVPIGTYIDPDDPEGKVQTKVMTFPAGTTVGNAYTQAMDLFADGAHGLAMAQGAKDGTVSKDALRADYEGYVLRHQHEPGFNVNTDPVARMKLDAIRAETQATAKPTAGGPAGPLVVATMPDQSLKVMGAEEAQQQKLFSYPLKDPQLVTQLAGGMNDLQTGINQLAKVNISNVQPGLAAALLEQQDPKLFAEMAPKLEGLGVGVSGGKLAIEGKVPDRVMAELRKMNVGAANADTRNYVVALQAAYEGLSQLPRLQTFGKTGRMLGHQVEAAQRMLTQPGDDPDMTQRKLNALQNIVDPIKKGIPSMPGAELTPSFRDAAGGGRGVQGRAVRDKAGKVLGYTTDGKTMTPVGAQ